MTSEIADILRKVTKKAEHVIARSGLRPTEVNLVLTAEKFELTPEASKQLDRYGLFLYDMRQKCSRPFYLICTIVLGRWFLGRLKPNLREDLLDSLVKLQAEEVFSNDILKTEADKYLKAGMYHYY